MRWIVHDGDRPSVRSSCRPFTRKQDVALLQGDVAKVESLVYGQSISTMWSTLESHIDDQILHNDAALLTGDELKKIKISLGEFQTMDDDLRLEYLLEEAKLAQKAKLARGPAVFERTLKVFGFDGPIEAETSREQVDFSAIRNCVAHRRGIVDRKFLAICTGPGFKLGEPLVLTKQHVARYFFASLQYAGTVFARAAARYEPSLKVANDYAAGMLEFLKEEQAKV